MKQERSEATTHDAYEFGSWLSPDQDVLLPCDALSDNDLSESIPSARERSGLLRLLGLINYRILSGGRVYIEVGGVVYKTLWGGYWRSVFTGVEHYLLRCQEVSLGTWAESNRSLGMVDLPIKNSREGWTANGYSLLFMLNRE
jgi:hypothetical protein